MNVLRSLCAPGRTLAFALLGLLALAATLDLRADRSEGPPRLLARAAASGELRAGAGSAAVSLPPGVVLAGYRAFGRSPEYGATPLHARSLLLEAGGVRTALVLLETLTLPRELVQAVREQAAAEGAGCTLIVASHTHSGPGGYDESFLPQLVLGRHDPAVEQAILEAVGVSLATARADLAPALLAVGEAPGAGLASNRDHRGEAVDERLTVVSLQRAGGSPVATLARFSSHPTLNPRGVGPAGDWPGFVMDRLEEKGGVAFVLPGSVGDARPTRAASPGAGAVRALLYAEAIAEAVGAVSLAEAHGEVAVGCAEVQFELPAADLTGMVPFGLGTLVSNLADPAAPRVAEAIAFRMGELALIGLPAEPIASMAPLYEQAAADAGLRGRVVGIAQGYASYAIGVRELEEKTISARNAWFGAELAPRLIEAARSATGALLAEPAPQGAVAAP